MSGPFSRRKNTRRHCPTALKSDRSTPTLPACPVTRLTTLVMRFFEILLAATAASCVAAVGLGAPANPVNLRSSLADRRVKRGLPREQLVHKASKRVVAGSGTADDPFHDSEDPAYVKPNDRKPESTDLSGAALQPAVKGFAAGEMGAIANAGFDSIPDVSAFMEAPQAPYSSPPANAQTTADSAVTATGASTPASSGPAKVAPHANAAARPVDASGNCISTHYGTPGFDVHNDLLSAHDNNYNDNFLHTYNDYYNYDHPNGYNYDHHYQPECDLDVQHSHGLHYIRSGLYWNKCDLPLLTRLPVCLCWSLRMGVFADGLVDWLMMESA
ncbi:hypothetical protein LTR10_004152 [Elasticomyces elasticus]|nr:hypothetical protein LTR10_004152 [Elasticomyces elasticus]KAK4977664.1 hypothetical protein LTR42_002035 [Elasticomyces elasticus]